MLLLILQTVVAEGEEVKKNELSLLPHEEEITEIIEEEEILEDTDDVELESDIEEENILNTFHEDFIECIYETLGGEPLSSIGLLNCSFSSDPFDGTSSEGAMNCFRTCSTTSLENHNTCAHQCTIDHQSDSLEVFHCQMKQCIQDAAQVQLECLKTCEE
jgi:hypothetical protein